MEFFRQEYWSGLPFPTPEDLPDPGIEPVSLALAALADRFFTTNTTWEAPLGRTAAPAAKSLQSYPTLCDPIDSSPPGSANPGILPERVLEWVVISFSKAWK